MSDPSATTPRKGPRPKNQNRHKQNDGTIPTTPGTKPLHAHDGFYSETQGSDSQTPIRRIRKTPNTHKGHHQGTASIPIASADGTTNSSTSPHKIQGHANNPNHSKNMTPIKQAYAGPTFHASPAPSSLPIPKFFSKSVPAGASHAIAQTQLGTSPIGQSMPPSPGPGFDSSDPQPPIPREASPLDLLFNAHRAEKARLKAGDISQGLSPPAQSFHGGRSYGPLTSTNLNHGQISQQPRPHDGQYLSGKELFMMELDGTGDQHDVEDDNRPTPFRERMYNARSSSSSANTYTKATLDEQDRLAKTLALKQLLKGMPAMSEQNTFDQPRSRDNEHHTKGFPGFGASPFHIPPSQTRQPLTPVQDDSAQSGGSGYREDVPFVPVPAHDMARFPAARIPSNPPDVKSMEADLRRILKLEPRT